MGWKCGDEKFRVGERARIQFRILETTCRRRRRRRRQRRKEKIYERYSRLRRRLSNTLVGHSWWTSKCSVQRSLDGRLSVCLSSPVSALNSRPVKVLLEKLVKRKKKKNRVLVKTSVARTLPYYSSSSTLHSGDLQLSFPRLHERTTNCARSGTIFAPTWKATSCAVAVLRKKSQP